MGWKSWNNTNISQNLTTNIEDNLINIEWIGQLEVTATYRGETLASYVQIEAPNLISSDTNFLRSLDNKFLTVGEDINA